MRKTVENGYGFSKDFGWRKGIEYDQTCDGFALTAAAYWDFLDENGLRTKLEGILTDLDHVAFSNLKEVGARSRSIMLCVFRLNRHPISALTGR